MFATFRKLVTKRPPVRARKVNYCVKCYRPFVGQICPCLVLRYSKALALRYRDPRQEPN